jgi:hypothetical protein
MAASNRVNLSPSMHHAWEACRFAARHRGASTSLSPRFQSRIGQKCASNCHLGIDTGKLKMRIRIATAIQHLGNLPVREDTAPRESANAAASRYGSPAAGPCVSFRDVFYQKRRGGRARLNAPDSKSGIGVTLSGVRIPPSPPEILSLNLPQVHRTEYGCFPVQSGIEFTGRSVLVGIRSTMNLRLKPALCV